MFMNGHTKQKVKYIVSLIEKRKILLEERESLNEYKNKIEKVRQRYARKSN